MNKDIEELLGRLTPRGTRLELRPQVLAAVAERLQADRASRRFRRAAFAVAALIVVGVALNMGLSRASDRRLAQLYGPPPVAKQALEIAQFVEKTTDAETARWVYQQLSPPSTHDNSWAAYRAYCKILERVIAESTSVSGPWGTGCHEDAPRQPKHSSDSTLIPISPAQCAAGLV